MAALKCPNPACPFQFDPTQVPPGAVLTCPQCRHQFTLGPPPPGYPPPGYPPPGYPPPGYPPPGYPPPGYPPPDPLDDVNDDAPSAAESRPGPRNSPISVGGYLAVAGGLMLFVGIAAGVFWVTARSKVIDQSGPGDTGEISNSDYNFALKRPPEPWAKDPDTQAKLKANVAGYHRTGPTAWAVLSASKYQKRNPSQYELQQKSAETLALQFENLPAGFDVRPTKWAGHDALRTEFRGVYLPTGEACFGSCTMLAHQGIGYWLYAWAPEKDAEAAAADLAAIEAGFRTLGQRADWTAKAPDKRVYRGHGHKFALTDYGRDWEKPKLKGPTDEDAKGVMFLENVLKDSGGGDFPPTADLVVLALDGAAADPMAAAREYVEKRYKQFADVKVGEWTGDPAGDPPIGPEDDSVPVVRLKVTRGDGGTLRSGDKLVVFSAVVSGGETIVAEASCPWRERPLWERKLMQVVRSLRPE